MTQATEGDPSASPALPLDAAAVVPTLESSPSRTERARRVLARVGTAEVMVLLAGLAVFSWHVGRPSPWWDEAITRDVTSRTSGEIVDLVQHVDLVHATYYLFVHALLGTSATVTPIRLLSVLAAALTGLLLVRLGRDLDAPRVGVLAGALWVVAPLSSRYAQEARPYAMVALAATAATVALVRLCLKPWLHRRWALYAGLIVLVGLLNVLALLLLVVHLCYVLAIDSPAVRRRWLVVAGGSVLLLSPLLIASSHQREQVAWLPRPAWGQLTGFLSAEFAATATVVGLVLLALVGTVRRTKQGGTHGPALALGLAWSLLPPLILWSVSQVHPLFDWRYVFFTVPGTMLALGSLATLLRARWLVAVVCVLALGGLHMQEVYRYIASGHAEDVRGAAAVIQQNAQAGDAVLFLPASRRVIKLGYPEAFAATDDIALKAAGEDSATLWGVEEPAKAIGKELKNRKRVWVVTGPGRFGEAQDDKVDTQKEHLLDVGFDLAGVYDLHGYEVRLYLRHGTSPLSLRG
ncbi:hypothetical protein ACIB24_05420 [Spongisporangium articulatum]|uniref:Glycosyltransferase RgtA/B/C/D-like domain-containing protein n=1 Tax=Spongisporangium articulatum TaxID=3362603 RepID=A0ABW8AJF0_9ACTN